ncbi:hypothetical protein HF320_02865 [Collinsella sp. KGMB02528]|uniref:Uncharacterized protein n=1 Tax=Collinsella acetigenes TaxID=2713419 RepID=A0A7X9YIK5_9ACTN|nr:hypothetical protein [Collinsella acetigenes]NMF55278.1 hypothetical protein [Collinsella acetigenes]
MNISTGYLEALADSDCGWFYRRDADTFKQIPGTPIAYWAGAGALSSYEKGRLLSTVANPKAGITTGNNDGFIHFWWECCLSKTGRADSLGASWFLCNKGGAYRKWYGNLENVMNFDGNAQVKMSELPGYRPVNLSLQGEESVSWSDITSGGNSFRLNGPGLMFDHVGISAFPKKDLLCRIAGFLNSSSAESFLKFISPTLHCNAGDIAKLPYLDAANETGVEIDAMTNECVFVSKHDWDSLETSWDFKCSPLI